MKKTTLRSALVLFLMLCLAFGMLGATPRGQGLLAETENQLSESFAETRTAETQTAETQSDRTASGEETAAFEPKVAQVVQVEEEEEFQSPAMSCYCNRQYAGTYKLYRDDPYVCVQGVMSALYPNAEFTESADSLSVQAEGIDIQITFGKQYFCCNNRYIYAESGAIKAEDGVYLPAEGVAKCFGGTVSLDEEAERLDITAVDIVPLQDGNEFYNETDLYWLSRIIWAEAGSESFEGQIAVGNVVVNRVNSPIFQDDIYSVIFATTQFDPVENGSIYMDPTPEAVVAAKLALDGCEIVPSDTLFFAVRYLGSGYSTVCWIGNHCFMTLA